MRKGVRVEPRMLWCVEVGDMRRNWLRRLKRNWKGSVWKERVCGLC
jgi:hypothetical protein